MLYWCGGWRNKYNQLRPFFEISMICLEIDGNVGSWEALCRARGHCFFVQWTPSLRALQSLFKRHKHWRSRSELHNWHKPGPHTCALSSASSKMILAKLSMIQSGQLMGTICTSPKLDFGSKLSYSSSSSSRTITWAPVRFKLQDMQKTVTFCIQLQPHLTLGDIVFQIPKITNPWTKWHVFIQFHKCSGSQGAALELPRVVLFLDVSPCPDLGRNAPCAAPKALTELIVLSLRPAVDRSMGRYQPHAWHRQWTKPQDRGPLLENGTELQMTTNFCWVRIVSGGRFACCLHLPAQVLPMDLYHLLSLSSYHTLRPEIFIHHLHFPSTHPPATSPARAPGGCFHPPP